jgi:hypothetical protein
MTPEPEEPWEARVARAAARRDRKVQRSRDWDPSLPDDGTYVLVNLWTNGVVAGPGVEPGGARAGPRGGLIELRSSPRPSSRAGVHPGVHTEPRAI